MPFDIEPNPGCRKWLTLVIVIIEERVSMHGRQDDVRHTAALRSGSNSKDLETGCPKLAIVRFWGIQIFIGDHNIFRF